MINIIYFIVSYIIMFIFYYIKNRKKHDYKDATKQLEITYLINKFKLNKSITKYNTLKWTINIINPLIISITFLVITNIESFLLSLIISFIVIIMLIYSLYEIIGKYLKKKESIKNV